MKYNICVLLLSVAAGIRLRDSGDLELPTLTDENDVQMQKKVDE